MADMAIMANEAVGNETFKGEAALKLVGVVEAADPVVEDEEPEGAVDVPDEDVAVFETVWPKDELVRVLSEADVEVEPEEDEPDDPVLELLPLLDEVDELVLLVEERAAMEKLLVDP